jgi:Putative Actinobacterial Holin-X, holin superfamily III
MAFTNYNRSIADILRDVIVQATTLLRKETELARVELSENVSRAALGIGLMVGGAVLLIPALVILLEAAVAALEQNGMRPAEAAGIIGGVALVLGLILIGIGVTRLRVKNLMPNKTIQQLQYDAAVAKQQMRRDYDLQRAA